MGFWRWVRNFALLGVAICVCFTAYWFICNGRGTALWWLWPPSLMFMALDEPTRAPLSTVIAVYGVAIVEDALLYAAAGAVLWTGMRLVQMGVRAMRSTR